MSTAKVSAVPVHGRRSAIEIIARFALCRMPDVVDRMLKSFRIPTSMTEIRRQQSRIDSEAIPLDLVRGATLSAELSQIWGIHIASTMRSQAVLRERNEAAGALETFFQGCTSVKTDEDAIAILA
eukprot:1855013-Amphidinium_carterae.1